MSEYLAVHMVDPAEVGDRFTMWPLHMTLLPWFDAPDVDTVATQFKESVIGIDPIETEVTVRDHFGPQRNIPVMLVRKIPELQKLHDSLLEAVESNGWDLRGRYTGEHYKPHITRKAGRDASGIVRVDAIYIAEKQGQGYREIVGKVDL